MRNGKRDRITFEASQASQASHASTISGPLLESSFPMPTDQSSPPLPPPRLPSQPLLSREVFATSAVMRELNLLKNEVRDIKSALSSLSRTQATDTALRHEVASMRRALSNILSSKGPDPHMNGVLYHLCVVSFLNSPTCQIVVCSANSSISG